MKKFDLGKIEKVDIRNIWEHEGTDLTPWLAKEENIEFIGRCGTYQYLDMHQVVNQSLLNVNRWIKDHE